MDNFLFGRSVWGNLFPRKKNEKKNSFHGNHDVQICLMEELFYGRVFTLEKDINSCGFDLWAEIEINAFSVAI